MVVEQPQPPRNSKLVPHRVPRETCPSTFRIPGQVPPLALPLPLGGGERRGR